MSQRRFQKRVNTHRVARYAPRYALVLLYLILASTHATGAGPETWQPVQMGLPSGQTLNGELRYMTVNGYSQMLQGVRIGRATAFFGTAPSEWWHIENAAVMAKALPAGWQVASAHGRTPAAIISAMQLDAAAGTRVCWISCNAPNGCLEPTAMTASKIYPDMEHIGLAANTRAGHLYYARFDHSSKVLHIGVEDAQGRFVPAEFDVVKNGKIVGTYNPLEDPNFPIDKVKVISGQSPPLTPGGWRGPPQRGFFYSAGAKVAPYARPIGGGLAGMGTGYFAGRWTYEETIRQGGSETEAYWRATGVGTISGAAVTSLLTGASFCSLAVNPLTIGGALVFEPNLSKKKEEFYHQRAEAHQRMMSDPSIHPVLKAGAAMGSSPMLTYGPP